MNNNKTLSIETSITHQVLVWLYVLQLKANRKASFASGSFGCVFLSFCLFVFLSFCLFAFLSFCLFVTDKFPRKAVLNNNNCKKQTMSNGHHRYGRHIYFSLIASLVGGNVGRQVARTEI